MKLFVLLSSAFAAYDGCMNQLSTENRIHDRLSGYASCLERDPFTPSLDLTCWLPYIKGKPTWARLYLIYFQDITKCNEEEAIIEECQKGEKFETQKCFDQLNECTFKTIVNFHRCNGLVQDFQSQYTDHAV